MAPVKLLLTHNLYRRPAATNELAANGYLPAGSSIEVTNVIIGKSIEGNSIWYQATDGCFYWSGGITDTVEFSGLPMAFTSLPSDQQLDVCRQAMNYFYPILAKRFPEITALSVSNKKSTLPFKLPGSGTQPVFYLSIFVANQASPLAASLQAGLNLPKQLTSISRVSQLTELAYKGFSIPVAIRNASPVVLCAPGGMITKPDPYKQTGTLGFIATDGTLNYLVTNYHVLCNDRLQANNRSLKASDLYDRDVQQNGQKVGRLLNGQFDGYTDCAKAWLQYSGITNTLTNGQTLSGIKFRSEFINFQAGQTDVFLVGAASGKTSKGTINALFAITPEIDSIKHVFLDVIQLNLKAAQGDSGGPVYVRENNTNLLIGILVASDLVEYSYVIPIGAVLQQLELTGLAQ